MSTINEQIVTGKKFRKLVNEATKLWQRISFWTKASDVEFDDGQTAEEKFKQISDKINTINNKINIINDQITSIFEKIDSITTPSTITPITPPSTSIIDYVSISGDSYTNDWKCNTHNTPLFQASVWYSDRENSDEKTFVITPKSPYTKIKASFHANKNTPVEGDTSIVKVNGHNLEFDGNEITLEASSFTIYCYAHTYGEEGHWQTSAYCCMHNITLT